jgi:hypothetical protein
MDRFPANEEIFSLYTVSTDNLVKVVRLSIPTEKAAGSPKLV